MVDNRKLISLLDDFSREISNEKYTQIIQSLYQDDVFLYVPAVHDSSGSGQWRTIAPGDSLKLTSLFQQDGHKILAVFSSEETMIVWAKQIVQYYAMEAKDVLKICEDYGIDRLVIDHGSPTVFVMQRQPGKVEKEIIPEDTPVSILPAKILNDTILKRLKRNFAEIPSLRKAYQYVMIRNHEHSRVIAFELTDNSEHLQEAVIQATQKAFYGEKVDMPVEVFFIETESTHDQIRKVDNSLIYERK